MSRWPSAPSPGGFSQGSSIGDEQDLPFETDHFEDFEHDEGMYRQAQQGMDGEIIDEDAGEILMEQGMDGRGMGGYRETHDEIDDEIVDEELVGLDQEQAIAMMNEMGEMADEYDGYDFEEEIGEEEHLEMEGDLEIEECR